MSVGDLFVNREMDSWVRKDPETGGDIGKYPRGSVFILMEVDPLNDPFLFYHKVLTPDGKIGWIHKKNVELVG